MADARPREKRETVSLRARLRTDAGWSDVTIGNVSPRGMMLRSTAPLEPRSFIEVRRQNVVVVGRIVWANGLQCGVATQDRVDIDNLKAAAPVPREGLPDRRASPRKLPQATRRYTAGERLDQSLRLARAFDFCTVAILCAIAAAFLAGAAFSAFSRPLDEAGQALAER